LFRQKEDIGGPEKQKKTGGKRAMDDLQVLDVMRGVKREIEDGEASAMSVRP